MSCAAICATPALEDRENSDISTCGLRSRRSSSELPVRMVIRVGLEPTACGFGDRYALQLHFRTMVTPTGLEPAYCPVRSRVPLQLDHGAMMVVSQEGFEPPPSRSVVGRTLQSCYWPKGKLVPQTGLEPALDRLKGGGPALDDCDVGTHGIEPRPLVCRTSVLPAYSAPKAKDGAGGWTRTSGFLIPNQAECHFPTPTSLWRT